MAETIEEAYEKALAADPVSAFGGVVVLNRPVSATLGERLAEQFVEVLFAPGYDAVAVDALVQKPSVRILNDMERRAFDPSEWDTEARAGRDARAGARRRARPAGRDGRRLRRARRRPAWDDLLFAWTVVKHMLSNAIVIAEDGRRRSASAPAR